MLIRFAHVHDVWFIINVIVVVLCIINNCQSQQPQEGCQWCPTGNCSLTADSLYLYGSSECEGTHFYCSELSPDCNVYLYGYHAGNNVAIHSTATVNTLRIYCYSYYNCSHIDIDNINNNNSNQSVRLCGYSCANMIIDGRNANMVYIFVYNGFREFYNSTIYAPTNGMFGNYSMVVECGTIAANTPTNAVSNVCGEQLVIYAYEGWSDVLFYFAMSAQQLSTMAASAQLMQCGVDYEYASCDSWIIQNNTNHYSCESASDPCANNNFQLPSSTNTLHPTSMPTLEPIFATTITNFTQKTNSGNNIFNVSQKTFLVIIVTSIVLASLILGSVFCLSVYYYRHVRHKLLHQQQQQQQQTQQQVNNSSNYSTTAMDNPNLIAIQQQQQQLHQQQHHILPSASPISALSPSANLPMSIPTSSNHSSKQNNATMLPQQQQMQMRVGFPSQPYNAIQSDLQQIHIVQQHQQQQILELQKHQRHISGVQVLQGMQFENMKHEAKPHQNGLHLHVDDGMDDLHADAADLSQMAVEALINMSVPSLVPISVLEVADFSIHVPAPNPKQNKHIANNNTNHHDNRKLSLLSVDENHDDTVGHGMTIVGNADNWDSNVNVNVSANQPIMNMANNNQQQNVMPPGDEDLGPMRGRLMSEEDIFGLYETEQ